MQYPKQSPFANLLSKPEGALFTLEIHAKQPRTAFRTGGERRRLFGTRSIPNHPREQTMPSDPAEARERVGRRFRFVLVSICRLRCRDRSPLAGKAAQRLASFGRQAHVEVPFLKRLRLHGLTSNLRRTKEAAGMSDDRFDELAGGEQHGKELLVNGEQMGDDTLTGGEENGPDTLAGGEGNGADLLEGGEQKSPEVFSSERGD
jgi:hypothetical protein